MNKTDVLLGRFPAEQVERIPVDAAGLADLAWLEARLAALSGAGERAMVAVQAANNETGAIQPVRRLAALVRAAGGVVVCDAVQAAGKIDVTAGDLGADFVFVSAHKIGGPQGVGALVAASPNVRIARPLMTGGGQERGARAGTENTPAIAGFGAAAAAVLADGAAEAPGSAAPRHARAEHPRGGAAGDDLRRGVAQAAQYDARALPGLSAETALIAFDLAGVAVSSGSACSSGKVKRSHVLDAMGVDPAVAAGAIRVSLGWSSDDDDVIRFASGLRKTS